MVHGVCAGLLSAIGRPFVAHCDACKEDVEIASVQSFRCPQCDELVSDLRQGRELEIESFEIEEAQEPVDPVLQRSSAIWKPIMMRDGWQPAAHRCDKSTPTASDTSKLKWWASISTDGTSPAWIIC